MGDSRTDSVATPRVFVTEENNRKHQRFITKEQTLLPGFWRQLYATTAVCFAAFSSGNVLGWMGPMALKLPLKESHQLESVDSHVLNSLFTIMQLSSIFNMMVCGYMMDTMGRRSGCWFLNLFAPAGWVFLATARTNFDLYAGGLMVGTIMAAGLVVGIVFISEVTNEKLRGPFLSLIVFFHSCGALFSHILGEFLPYKPFNLTCLLVSLLFPFVFHPLPESPMFLVLKSRLVEAKASLEWYHGNDPETVENEMLKLQNADKRHVNRCKTMISSKADIISLTVILFLSILSELCGTSVIETYTGVIIKNTIRRPDAASEISLILAFFRFFAGLASVYIVEKTGRRIMLTISLGVMAFSLFLLSLLLKISSNNQWHNKIDVWTVCAALIIYTLANQVCLAVVEVICSEIAASDKRGMFMAIGGMFKILTLISCLQIYTSLTYLNAYGNFLFEASACVVGLVIVIRTIPETRGKTLAYIRGEIEGEILPQRCEGTLPTREKFKLKKPSDII